MLTHLPYRGIICVEGIDRLPFLQGMLTQDMNLLEHQKAVYTLHLNRMGRILGDMWVIPKGTNTWWIDTENPEALAKEWMSKKLRYKVNITHLSDQNVYACWNAPINADLYVEDTRHPAMGGRIYGRMDIDTTSLREYRLHTLSLGIPDGSLDFEIERSMPLPWGCEHAIGWNKGCYIGQESVARSKYQGIVRQHILPIEIHHDATWYVDAIQDIYDISGQKQGRLVSRFENLGLALLSIDTQEKPLKIRLSAT